MPETANSIRSINHDNSSTIKVEALSSDRVVCCPGPPRIYGLLRLLQRRRLAFHLAAYSWAHGSCGLPTIGDLSCFCIRCDDIPLPIRRGVHRGCAPDSSPLPWPSPESKWFGSPFSVCRRCRISFMVRTAILHLLLGGILRFHTSSCPGA